MTPTDIITEFKQRSPIEPEYASIGRELTLLHRVDPHDHLGCIYLSYGLTRSLEKTTISIADAIERDWVRDKNTLDLVRSKNIDHIYDEYREVLQQLPIKSSAVDMPIEPIIDALVREQDIFDYIRLDGETPDMDGVTLSDTIPVLSTTSLSDALADIRTREDGLFVVLVRVADTAVVKTNIVLKANSSISGFFQNNENANYSIEKPVQIRPRPNPWDLTCSRFDEAQTIDDLPDDMAYGMAILCQGVIDQAKVEVEAPAQYLTSELAMPSMTHKTPSFTWDNIDFINGTLGHALHERNVAARKYRTAFSYENHPLIQQYGTDFTCDPERGVFSALQSLDQEFMVDALDVECYAYAAERKRLADHIRMHLAEEYRSFGGILGLDAWWRQTCTMATETIERLVVQAYLEEELIDPSKRTPTLAMYDRESYPGAVAFVPEKAIPDNDYSNYTPMAYYHFDKFVDPLSGGRMTTKIQWAARDYQDLCTMAGDPKNIPAFLTHWGFAHDKFGYGGNPNLKLTDATNFIKFPFDIKAEGYAERETKFYKFSWLYPTRINSIKRLKKQYGM